MRHMGPVSVAAILVSMSMRGYVVRDIFVYWSNMLARFVSWAITG
jgi:hypothetical protein